MTSLSGICYCKPRLTFCQFPGKSYHSISVLQCKGCPSAVAQTQNSTQPAARLATLYQHCRVVLTCLNKSLRMCPKKARLDISNLIGDDR